MSAHSGRIKTWLKTKCFTESTFVIVIGKLTCACGWRFQDVRMKSVFA
jgi:hypothetical protein